MIFFKEKVPVVLQMEATECGAACLAMVLSAHKRWVTLEEARAACGTSRDGVNAASLLTAARAYGLTAKALKREPEQLRELPMPQILHWRFEHFVVLESVQGDRYTLLDPAVGRRVVTGEEMSRSFTGLTIAAQPNSSFASGGERPSVMKQLIDVAAQSPGAMTAVGLISLIGVLPGLALSGAIAVFVDHIAQGGQTAWLPYVLAALFAVATMTAGLSYFSERCIAGLKAKVATLSATRSFWHALFLPISFFAQRSSGELTSRLRLGSEIGSLVAGPLANMVPSILVSAIFVAFLAIYNPTLAGVALIVCLVNLSILTFLSERVASRNRELQLAEGRANGLATSGLHALDTYRMLGREQMLVSKWAVAEDRALNTEQRLGLVRSIAQLGPTASHLILSAVVLGVGAFLVMNGQMTIGGLVASQVIVGLLNRPIASLAASLCQLQEGAGALMRIQDLQSHPLDEAYVIAEKDAPPQDTSGTLTLNSVAFGYAPGQTIVSDIELKIQPGQMIAVLGASGSGKSTLARLAAGLLSPTSGEVLLDGRRLPDWPTEELRKQLVFVTQNASVFTGSVADNIRMWQPHISTKEVVEATHAAGLDSSLARHHHGLNTQVSHLQGGLSGGELQRMTLARAIAHKPSVMVLDETTSALDPSTEAEVLEGLRNTGATILIVTHKPGTAMRCDEAIYLEAGRVAAHGRPSDLLNRISDQPLGNRYPAMPSSIATEPRLAQA